MNALYVKARATYGAENVDGLAACVKNWKTVFFINRTYKVSEMEKNKEDALRKIAGLMNLAEGKANENESRVAALKASKLLAQYQITETELMLYRLERGESSESDSICDDEDGIDVLNFHEGNRNPYMLSICNLLAEIFKCKVYVNSGRGTVHFFGSENDIEVCIYFSEVIHNFIEANAWEKFPKKAVDRLHFWMGAHQTVTPRIFAIKKEMEKEMQRHVKSRDLIVIKDKLVDSCFEKLKEMKEMKATSASDKKTDKLLKKEINKGAYLQGTITGKNTPLNKAID